MGRSDDADGDDADGGTNGDERDTGTAAKRDSATVDAADADADETDGSGDRLLDIAGIAIVVFLVFGVAVGAFAALSGPSDDTDAAPDVEWSLERVNDSHVRIVHAGGERVPSRDLVVTSDGVQRRGAWPNTLSEGDSGTVRAGEGEIVRLYWTTETGERVKLAEWEP